MKSYLIVTCKPDRDTTCIFISRGTINAWYILVFRYSYIYSLPCPWSPVLYSTILTCYSYLTPRGIRIWYFLQYIVYICLS
ncbi:hypothetical protein [Kochikohdavirus PBEF19]|uniref:Uncharacterized protein n=1 Tax=Enterococcus phage PBEF129 TaxID=2696337 RepID=A0A7T3MK42_9CAUD|nr:hypothetical protein [Enterococcus phage PBEF129]